MIVRGCTMAALTELEIAHNIKLEFEKKDDLIIFLEDELQRWSKVESAATQYAGLRDLAVGRQVSQLRELIQQTRNAPGNDLSREVPELHRYKERQKGERILCSRIPSDAAALLLLEQDPDAAVVGMIARQAVSLKWENIRGNPLSIVHALDRFEAAASGREGHADSFATLLKEFSTAMVKWRQDVDQAVSDTKQAESSALTQVQNLTEQAKKQAEDYEKRTAEHQTRLKSMEDKFLKDMALRGPVAYWDLRARSGKRIAWGWLVGFVVAALAIFGLVIQFGPGLLTLLKDKNEQISLAAVPLLLAALIPLLWVLRHMARMFADNIADARDAAQRAALTSTYLALSTQEEVDFSKEERAIITQALFRPSPAQPTEDGVPLPLLELLKRG